MCTGRNQAVQSGVLLTARAQEVNALCCCHADVDQKSVGYSYAYYCCLIEVANTA